MVGISAVARGGMERQVIQLLGGLKQRGHEVLLVAQKGVADYHEELTHFDVEHLALGCHGKFDVAVLGKLVRVVRTWRPDVVLCENFNATLWTRLAAVATRTPCVTAEHTTGRQRKLKIVITNRLLGPFTSRVVACAYEQVAFLVEEGNPQDSIRVIHNGVDLGSFAGDQTAGELMRTTFSLPSDATVIGIVAAHRPEKRHDRFFELIAMLRSSGHPVHGLVVGGGPLLEQNRRTAEAHVCADYLRVVGPVSEMKAAYSAMDAVVFVSDLETLPMAALEAQACGCPVFALAAGGLHEAVNNGVTGHVVPKGDLSGLADVLTDAICSPGTLQRMGAAGRSWVASGFSNEGMVDRFEHLLEEVCNEQ